VAVVESSARKNYGKPVAGKPIGQWATDPYNGSIRLGVMFFFYVLLTVHLSIILVINQLILYIYIERERSFKSCMSLQSSHRD